MRQREKEQSESCDERQRRRGDRGGWGVGRGRDSGEGREREKLPRCLKMVHSPAPAPMTLVCTFPPSSHKTSLPYITFAYFA